MIRVGDKLEGVYPSTFTPEERGLKPARPNSGRDRKIPVEARVCYIHPEHRYLVAKFTFPHGGSFRECVWIRRRKA